jgi:hypothetical protein
MFFEGGVPTGTRPLEPGGVTTLTPVELPGGLATGASKSYWQLGRNCRDNSYTAISWVAYVRRESCFWGLTRKGRLPRRAKSTPWTFRMSLNCQLPYSSKRAECWIRNPTRSLCSTNIPTPLRKTPAPIKLPVFVNQTLRDGFSGRCHSRGGASFETYELRR